MSVKAPEFNPLFGQTDQFKPNEPAVSKFEEDKSSPTLASQTGSMTVSNEKPNPDSTPFHSIKQKQKQSQALKKTLSQNQNQKPQTDNSTSQKKLKKNQTNQKSNSSETPKKDDKILTLNRKDKAKGASADNNSGQQKADDKGQKGVHSWRNYNNMGLKSVKATTQLQKEQDPETENIMNLIDGMPQ